eukprot:m.183622 g.183622  ORF g.183622 m.183622 type:complete len:75 (-) comp18481_c1_seq1:81-305(-)
MPLFTTPPQCVQCGAYYWRTAGTCRVSRGYVTPMRVTFCGLMAGTRRPVVCGDSWHSASRVQPAETAKVSTSAL